MMNLRLALFGGSALLLAMSGMSIVACSDNTNDGLPSATKHDSGTGDDDDDDDDDDASTTTGDASTGSKDGGSSDSSTKSDSSSSSSFADIYGCGSDNDCASGQHCVINAYDGWDASSPDYATGTKCDLKASQGSVCKDTADIVASDLYTCTQANKDAGGAYTACPGNTTCQVIEVYSKEFGACLPPNTTTGCTATTYVPYTGSPNYCFSASNSTTSSKGCVAPNVVCCDLSVSGTYQASCVADVSDCKLP